MAIRRAIVLRGAAYAALLLSLFPMQLHAAFNSCPAGQVRVFRLGNWTGSCPAAVGVNYSSPSTACAVGVGCIDSNTSSATYTSNGFTQTSGTNFGCPYTRTQTSNGAVTNGTGTTGNSTACIPASSICTTSAGDVRWFDGSSPGGASFCGADHCTYTGTSGIEFPGSPSSNQFSGVSSGTYCSTPNASIDSGLPITTGGNTISSYNSTTKCGVIDTGGGPESVCFDTLGDGECTVTSGGNGVCVMTGASADVADLTSPEAPDNGTPGVPADPDLVIRDNTNGLTGTVYDPGTVGGSTHTPGPGAPDGDGDDDGDGTCEVGEECSQKDAECGVVGKPPCKVRIDETGVTDDVPEDMAGESTDPDTDGFAEDVAGVAEAAPQEGWGIGDLVPDMEESPCQSITVNFIRGHTKTFPTPELCEFLDDRLKPTLAFFLYIIAALGIAVAGIRASAPQS